MSDPAAGLLFAIRLTVPFALAGAVADALETFAEAVSAFEVAPGGDWKIEGIGTAAPDRGRLSAALALIAAAHDLPEPGVTIEALPQTDWVAENQRSFRPIHAGRFIAHPSHDRPDAPGKIALCIDAGEAFGSGEHETTRGCLLAIDGLARRWPPGRGIARKGRAGRALDMGCGTGILALAVARAWRSPVLGVDLAPESVRVAEENARINQAGALVRAVWADGFKGRAVKRRRYDLIAANILQRPLIAMAPALAARLLPGGALFCRGSSLTRRRPSYRRIAPGAWCWNARSRSANGAR